MRKFFTHSTKGTKYGQQLRLSIKQATTTRNASVYAALCMRLAFTAPVSVLTKSHNT